jgi:hypothetical protein
MTFVRTLPAIGGLAAVAVVSAATPALAEPLVHERFHESSSEVVEEFCGDLTVREDIDFTGTFVGNPHGPDELFYGLEHLHGTHSWTNLANGKTFTVVVNVLNKDQRVTDNGDGTLTIQGLSTGSEKIYGPDGKLLFNNPGQVRFETLIDHGGTPTDPTDDEFLEFLGIVKGSTGRNDTEGRDFCTDIHEFIG